jgi:ribosomal-protein-alanine N-acetyltransferase
VFLSRPRPSDEREVLRLTASSKRLHRSLVSPPANGKDFAAYLARCRRRDFEGFLARRRDDGAIAGVFNLSQIALGHFRSAYLGYYAAAENAGRGYMTAALELVLAHAFGRLGLHRVEANIQPGNHRSIALVRRLGFEREGYSPGYLEVAGRFRDHERWAIRAETFRRPEYNRGRRQEVAMAKKDKNKKDKKDKMGGGENPEVMICQCVGAIGQGAGTTPLSRQVVKFVRRTYLPGATEHADQWDQHEVEMLELARTLGRWSAWHAAAAGSPTILPAHFKKALGCASKLPAGVFALSPITCRWC